MPKMVITKETVEGDIKYMEGHFTSPLFKIAPELFGNGNENIARASWQGLFPKNGAKNGLIIHLAGTGDHSFFRRRWGFANDLLKCGISSILLENPFYGSRRPKDQFRSSLSNVSDLFVMGGSLIAECCFILKWAKSEGYFPLGLSGVSMGGHMASLAITNVQDHQTVVVPCLSWTSAAPVYTLGALSTAIPWEVLQNELDKNDSLKNTINSCGWIEAMESTAAIQLFPKSPAKRLMWSLMSDFTDLSNYPMPKNTSLIRSIIAEGDAYVLRMKEIPDLAEIWPGSSVFVIPGAGHVSAYFGHHSMFRQAILDSITSISKPITDLMIADTKAGFKMNLDIRTAAR